MDAKSNTHFDREATTMSANTEKRAAIREILKNGAEVTMRRQDVVLAIFRGEFVTWKTDNHGNAYWGHYFGNDATAAVVDFAKRTNSF